MDTRPFCTRESRFMTDVGHLSSVAGQSPVTPSKSPAARKKRLSPHERLHEHIASRTPSDPGHRRRLRIILRARECTNTPARTSARWRLLHKKVVLFPRRRVVYYIGLTRAFSPVATGRLPSAHRHVFVGVHEFSAPSQTLPHRCAVLRGRILLLFRILAVSRAP
jgi:hypothetical protein